MNYEELEAANNRDIEDLTKAVGQYTGSGAEALRKFLDIFITELKAGPAPRTQPIDPASIDAWAQSVSYQIDPLPGDLVELTERTRHLAQRYSGQLRIKALLRKWDVSGNESLESRAEKARAQLRAGGLNIDDDLNGIIDQAVTVFKQALLGRAFEGLKQLAGGGARFRYHEQVTGRLETIFKRLKASGIDSVSANLPLSIEFAANEACARLAENWLVEFETNQHFIYANADEIAEERGRIETLFGLGDRKLDSNDKARLDGAERHNNLLSAIQMIEIKEAEIREKNSIPLPEKRREEIEEQIKKGSDDVDMRDQLKRRLFALAMGICLIVSASPLRPNSDPVNVINSEAALV